ncbi:hypothetical protein HPB51_025012 [Rhipicephalus microplus]|uniref:Tick transposon n=1 Tax=Rhipicephalus microplus TaxID=6941 RepID=A0A9J6E4K0_RHIMP|nr:hypothetical protein HPB51_025012 [Rhipicephalus microplus]
MQQLRQFQRLADKSTELLWARQLPVLRTGVAKKVTDHKPTVYVPEQITVPPDILRTLSLGPKFAVEPKTSPPELLAMVRQVSRHVPEQEQPHSVSEGVDTVSRYRPAGSKIPLRRVEAFLKEHSLTILPADKEGGFAVLSLGLFDSKAHTAKAEETGKAAEATAAQQETWLRDHQVDPIQNFSAPGRQYQEKRQGNSNARKPPDYMCRRCARTHAPRKCPAFGRACYNCQRKNHFAICCKEGSQVNELTEVSGIRVHEMSYVWLLNMKTDEAKKTLLGASLLSVKDWPGVVVDPERQEVRLKFDCVAFYVHVDNVRRAFQEYGEVKEVISDKWRDEGFEEVESTRRFVRPLLREGLTKDRIPLQICLGSSTTLAVVPERAPLYLRCRNTGHLCRDCRLPRCAGCRAFGHERVDCTRSYASAASAATNADHIELLMNDQKAERAVASEAAVEVSHIAAASETEMETPKRDTDESMIMGTPTQWRSTWTETQHKPEPVIGPNATLDMHTVETTPVK